MKMHKALGVWVAVAAACFSGSTLRAADGTWTSTASGLWSAGGNWSGAVIADGADFTADFSTLNISADTTISLDSVRTIGNLVFGDTTASHNWTVNNNGNAANILTLDVSSGAPTITVNNQTATISAVLAGNDGLTKTGAGILSLSATNTFTGLVSVNGGTLNITTNASLGDAANNISLNSGILRLANNSTTFGTGRTLTLGASGGTLSINPGNFTTNTFAGNITGTGALNLDGINSQLNLTGTNDYSGGTNIVGGRVQLSSSAVSSLGAGSINVSNGGLIAAGAYTTVTGWLNSNLINTASSGGILLSGNSSENINMGAYSNLMLGASANATYTGTLTPAGGVYRLGGGGLGGALTLSGTNALTGSSSLVVGNGTVAGYGRIVLSGSNNYSGGTTVTNGSRLIISNNSGAGTGAVNVDNGGEVSLSQSGVVVNNVLNLYGSSIGVANINAPLYASGAGTKEWAGDVNLLAASRFGVDSTSGNILVVSGDIDLGTNALTLNPNGSAIISLTGTISGSGPITISSGGTSMAIISGDNSATYSGETRIERAVLAVGHNNAFGSGNIRMGVNDQAARIQSTDSTARTFSNTFSLVGSNSNSIYRFGATSGGTGNLTFSNTANIALGNLNKKFEVFNRTEFAGGFTGTGSLTLQNSTGTLVLSGTNTYTGATTVSSGTLLVNGSLAAGSAVTVASGASLGGGGTINGAVTVNGSITPGNSIGTMTVANDVTWNGSAGQDWKFELGVTSGSSDLLSLTGAGSDFLKGTGSDFNFDFLNTGVAGTFVLVDWDDAALTTFSITDFTYAGLASGLTGSFAFNGSQLEFTTAAIPEPSTYALMAFGLGALALLRRKKK